MCQLCKNMIYDILINPLPLTNLLHGYINFKSLTRCALEVSDCFYRVVKDFPSGPEFFKCDTQIPAFISTFECDEIVWNRYHEKYPALSSELKYAIDICIDNSIGRVSTCKELLIKQFLMDRLRQILVLIPNVHMDHTLKRVTGERVSIGPVCKWKIIAIRRLAGLPLTNYLLTNVYRF